MKSRMESEVKWVWLLTSIVILYIVTSFANA
jgi:hypothetical protein